MSLRTAFRDRRAWCALAFVAMAASFAIACGTFSGTNEQSANTDAGDAGIDAAALDASSTSLGDGAVVLLISSDFDDNKPNCGTQWTPLYVALTTLDTGCFNGSAGCCQICANGDGGVPQMLQKVSTDAGSFHLRAQMRVEEGSPPATGVIAAISVVNGTLTDNGLVGEALVDSGPWTQIDKYGPSDPSAGALDVFVYRDQSAFGQCIVVDNVSVERTGN